WASYNAMLPEISEDEKNRIQISNLQAIFTLLASIIGLVLPLLFRGMMSKDELINFMALIFIPIIICIIIISIYIMVFKIREPVEDLLKDMDKAGGKTLLAVKNEYATSLKEEFKNLFLPLKNRDFAIFQGTTFFINAGLKIPLTILLPILEYVLFISDDQLPIYILIVLPFAVLGFFVWSKFPSKYGLRKSFLISLITISLILLSTLILLGNFSIAVIRLLGLLIIALFLFAMIPIFVYPSPIVSKIIDTEIEKEIERNGPFKTAEERYRFSGRFFGFYTMILNFAAGVGTLILGLILKGNEQNPVIITLLLPLTGLFTIIASMFLKKMKIR
ncbi:MAG: MFS transporter, partial [Promethearchaeota archaeon]